MAVKTLTIGELKRLLDAFPEHLCVGVQGYRQRYFGDIKATLIQVEGVTDVEWGYRPCVPEENGIEIVVLDAGPHT